MARSSELELIQAAHRAAQARLGLAIAYLSQVEWATVSAANPGVTSADWLERTTRAIIVGRRRSMELAKSYFQLSRALDSGYVMGMPDLPEGSEITLPALRDHFVGLLEKTAQLGFGETGSGGPDDQWVERLLAEGLEPSNARHDQFLRSDLGDIISRVADAMDDDNPLIRVDRWRWTPDFSDEYLAGRITPELRKRAVEALEAKNRERKKMDLTRQEQLRRAAEDHRKSGSSGAGIVDQLVVQGGRNLLVTLIRADARAKLVARGTSATPCGFCAMLASRGFVYTSAATAGFTAGGVSDIHPNCHCFPIIRWVDVDNDQLPALNQYFMDQWPKITAGYSGAAARRVWRNWISQRTTGIDTTSLEETT